MCEDAAQDAGDPQAARLRVGSEELADGHAGVVAECLDFRGCGKGHRLALERPEEASGRLCRTRGHGSLRAWVG